MRRETAAVPEASRGVSTRSINGRVVLSTLAVAATSLIATVVGAATFREQEHPSLALGALVVGLAFTVVITLTLRKALLLRADIERTLQEWRADDEISRSDYAHPEPRQ